MKDTERERGRDTGRGRSRFHAGSLTWDWIPGPQDHALSQRRCSTAELPGAPPLPSCCLIECGCERKTLAASFGLQALQYHYPYRWQNRKRELLRTP